MNKIKTIVLPYGSVMLVCVCVCLIVTFGYAGWGRFKNDNQLRECGAFGIHEAHGLQAAKTRRIESQIHYLHPVIY